VTDIDRCYQLIKRPVVTEKATDGTVGRNAYTFRVPSNANKVEIRLAVEKVFNVRVTDVNTLRVRGKWRRRGRTVGRQRSWKKAMVVLAEGQTIDVL